MKTMFIEARSKQDALPVAKLLLKKLKKYNTVGLVATVQHLDGLATIRNYFEINGKKAILGETGSKSKYPGQVLGCDVGAAKSIEDKVDAFVFLGTGRFHPLAIAEETNKPVFVANPFLNHIEQITPAIKRWHFRKRVARVSKVKAAKKIGILVSIKPGQKNLELANKIKKMLKQESFIFIGDTIDPASMRNFSDIEAWINTACPRMIEDQEQFGKPIVNWNELFPEL